MESIDLVKQKLLSFFHEMHEWEEFSQKIDIDETLSEKEIFQKKKENLIRIFEEYCTNKERKEGRPNIIQ